MGHRPQSGKHQGGEHDSRQKGAGEIDCGEIGRKHTRN